LRGLSLDFKINNKKDWYLKMTNKKNHVEFGYYSKLLKEPFDSIEDLKAAEAAYNAKMKAKEDAAAMKKADALKVEDAFKALNAARKTYKENLTQLTKEYAESLDNLKKAFELGKKDIHNQLAEAEEAYQAALKEFADKHPEGYHLTLKDGDFETTVGKQTSENTPVKKPVDLFDLFFGW
jgi:predicted  nucleic acid-binding Zn-ribbon protein